MRQGQKTNSKNGFFKIHPPPKPSDEFQIKTEGCFLKAPSADSERQGGQFICDPGVYSYSGEGDLCLSLCVIFGSQSALM